MQDLHRPVGAGISLEQVLCVVQERVVGNDWCVRWRGRWLQIDARHASLNLPRRRVTVRELASSRLLLDHQGETLTFTELAARPEPIKAHRPIVNNRRRKPAAAHPWKIKAAEQVEKRFPPCRVTQATPSRRGRAEILSKST